MNIVYLGLGGNVGDVRQTLINAIKQMNAHTDIKVLELSSLYKTPPWGNENQDWFLNACAKIQTNLEPLALLDYVKGLEKAFKRVDGEKWGPRTLDIDLLVYEDASEDEAIRLNHERLTLPHPRVKERAFVLLPLSNIAPELKIEGKAIFEHLRELDTSDIELFGQGGKFKPSDRQQ